jgi:putative hydrolase of the HAD superfamily
VGESLKLTQAQTTELYVEFFAGNRMDYDLMDLVRSLRPRYKTAILSNATDVLRSLLTHRWRVADAFDEIIISAEEGCRKPGPEIYQITLQKLSLAPGAVVFIDDRLDNIETARQEGMHAIHFQSPEQAKSDLKKLLSQYNSSYE